MPMHDWTRVDANYFHHFHLNWISSLSHALNNGLLPEGYYARAEKVQPPYIPDLLTIQWPEALPAGGTTTMARPKTQYADVATRAKPLQPPQRQIAVRDARGDRVVAVIEIVSRSNKKGRGAREFVDKAVMLLENGVHLLVLDCYPPRQLVPVGEPLPEVSLYLTPVRYVSLPLEKSYQYAFESFCTRERNMLEV